MNPTSYLHDFHHYLQTQIDLDSFPSQRGIINE